MGHRFQFTCSGCGLSAMVSGGPDAGFCSVTDTYYCRTCGTLQDVVTCWHPEDDSGNDSTPIPTCDRCGSLDLFTWQEGSPCPACKGIVVKNEADGLLWD